MRSLLVLLCDGLGDRAHPAHGGRTANEAAATPALDALAARGTTGLLWPLGPGRAPSSEIAHWAMLGYAPSEFPGRAVLEARGHGLEPAPGDVVAYASLRSTTTRDGALWATGRAGPEDAADAQALLAAASEVPSGPRGPFGPDAEDHVDPGAAAPRRRRSAPGPGRPGPGAEVHLYLVPLLPGRGEGILVVRGPGAHDGVTDTDPFLRDRHPIMRPQPLVPAAEATAATAEAWSRAVHRALAAHGRNAARRAAGRAALDAVTLKWWGRPRPAPTLRARHGLDGVMIGGSPFLAGLAATTGMRFVRCAEDVDTRAAMEARLDLARAALDGGATLVLCHLKATDEAGHSKDPAAKRAAIEAVDRALGDLGRRFADVVVCVTGDHATPPAPAVIHSGDPVPLVIAGPGVRADRVRRFGELDCADGLLGRITGADLMPVLLNAADRALFLGSRPTTTASPAGVPVDVEPLRP
jgi:2,3-bisphosphoglycerate-independent phosphoglycerate mutase